MKPFFNFIVLIATASASVGCSMCCGPYDYDYPAFGGKNERVDRSYGRIGSVFSDPNASLSGESADSNLASAASDRSQGRDNGQRDDSLDLDADIEKFKRDLEPIKPIIDQPGLDGNPKGRDRLPEPDDVPKDPTAMRLMRQRQLQGQWR